MLKRILVVLGGTPYANNAIRHAVEIAQRHGARVTGIAVLDREAPHVARLGLKVVEERIDANVAELESRAREATVELRVSRQRQEPVQALCEAWRYHDLTVMGMRGLFEHGVVEKPKEAVSHLIRSGVHPIFATSKDYRAIRRVLIAYSGSLESAATMKIMMRMRLWPKAAVSLIYFTDGEENRSSYQRLLDDASDYCAGWGIELEAAARIGGASDHLVTYAVRQDADVIVMGDSARSLLTRRIFGDATLKVIREFDRSVFISH